MELEQVLRSQGHRVTKPRRVVWDVLEGADTHMSAQQIADEVRSRDSGINVSSVYRALGLFDELELVRESKLAGDATSRWEISHADAVIHLVCSDCNTVIHHDAALVEQLRRQLADRIGFDASEIDVRVTGHCAACRAG